MTEEEKTQLLDLAAFITWSIDHDKTLNFCLTNVAHDCHGLLFQGQYFVPRSNDYQNKIHHG